MKEREGERERGRERERGGGRERERERERGRERKRASVCIEQQIYCILAPVYTCLRWQLPNHLSVISLHDIHPIYIKHLIWVYCYQYTTSECLSNKFKIIICIYSYIVQYNSRGVADTKSTEG